MRYDNKTRPRYVSDNRSIPPTWRITFLRLNRLFKGSKSHNFVSIGSMHNVYMEWMGSPFTHADVE